MSRITVEVESTIGSAIGKSSVDECDRPASGVPSAPGVSDAPDTAGAGGARAVRAAGDGSGVPSVSGPSGGVRGWPVGQGSVEDTLAPDGRAVRTMVLMPEPARPGDEVTAWPVALLHLNDGRRDVDEVLCVAEAEPFVDLVDAADLGRWHAEPDVWATALGRLSPGAVYRVTGCGGRREADQLVSDARHAYLRLTGCLE
ncbi:inorganic diphosphatase [Streptomyces sp. NPDC052042]|uniref:inorganic diphosphatase n=1 Tax=Streptomyces sp. NPDC052042 TaxID=3365683 RepID=UPI0037D6F31C